jgi:hypothetical protein
MSDSIRLVELADRISTFAVYPAEGEGAVGYLRVDEDEGVFVVRDRGSARRAASVARFETSEDATAWLLRAAGMAKRGAALGATTKGRRQTHETKAAIAAAQKARQADPAVRARTLEAVAKARAKRHGREAAP